MSAFEQVGREIEAAKAKCAKALNERLFYSEFSAIVDQFGRPIRVRPPLPHSSGLEAWTR